MRIINPQEAILTNVEVLAHLSSNPPRRPPNAPPDVNQRHWIPAPDLRDHNTVVKEIHNYVSRLSPHLYRYPSFKPTPVPRTKRTKGSAPAPAPEPPTALDNALKELVTRLQPFELTKGEVLMLVNLGVGLPPGTPGATGDENNDAEGVAAGDGEMMDVDTVKGQDDTGDGDGDGQGEGVGEEGEEEEAGDYGALALIDSVIEEREQRLSEEDVSEILAIVRETLGKAT
ncbi:hypothetical protein BJX99DRAFT_217674 [Aspergillus californicus]